MSSHCCNILYELNPKCLSAYMKWRWKQISYFTHFSMNRRLSSFCVCVYVFNIQFINWVAVLRIGVLLLPVLYLLSCWKLSMLCHAKLANEVENYFSQQHKNWIRNYIFSCITKSKVHNDIIDFNLILEDTSMDLKIDRFSSLDCHIIRYTMHVILFWICIW